MKGNTFFAFLSGLLIGAGAAILFAPSSGEEIRKKIKDSFDKEYNKLKDKFENYDKEVKDIYNDAETEAEKAAVNK